MKKGTIFALGFLMALSLASPVLAAARGGILPNGDRYAVDMVIVALGYDAPRLATGNTVSGVVVTGNDAIDHLCRQVGVTSVEPFYPGRLTKPALVREASRMYIFTLAEAVDAAAVLGAFRELPEIEIAELSIIPELCYDPNDAFYISQWHLRQVSANLGWDTVRGDTTRHSVIGIVDTGIQYAHPDLAPNVWINAAEDANNNGVFDSGDNDHNDADGNGYVDDVVGWDFGDNDNTPIDNSLPHGTPVAGAASEATDNGIQGAAIGFSARLMSIKVFDGGLPVNAFQGVLYAAESGARIIICAWSYGAYSQFEQNLLTAAWSEGALIVAPAAAQGNDIENYPAAYEHVMAVAALDRDDHKTSFSSYGVWIDISAPGIDIMVPVGPADFQLYSGTSFSAAQVAGLAGLIRAWRPGLTPDETEFLIESTSDPIDSLNPGYAGRLGAGRINCANWTMTPVFDDSELPSGFVLSQNYPNPFNARTVIRFVLPTESDVTLDIYNILGERVATLSDGCLAGGPHEIIWDASGAASGAYFYRLSAGGQSDVKRCLLVK